MTNRLFRMATALAFSGAMLLSLPAVAQDTAQQGPPSAGARGHRGGMRRDRTQMLTKKLNLIPEQATQVQAINADQRQQMQALRGDTNMSREDRRSKMMSIRQASQSKIRALLTPDQQTKYDELQAKMKDKGRGMGRRQNRGGEAPAPPQ